MTKYVIGVDAGTTCFKAGIYDNDLRMIAQSAEEYQLIYTCENYIEFLPEQYWEIFCRLIQNLLKTSNIPASDISGISICSQGETIIFLDENGDSLRNAIVWTDARATVQSAELRLLISDREVFEITGQREITATWPATKILWMKENQPELFRKTAHFLLLEDYLIYRLTGKYATDKSLSSSTVYMDIRNGIWWDKMLRLIGISEQQLPILYESGCQVAPVSGMKGAECGLTSATMVVSGSLDQAGGMLGAGNISAGFVTETTGTCLAVCTNIGGFKLSFDDGLLPVHYGIIPGNYYTIYWSAAAGSIYRWVRDVFYQNMPLKHLFNLIDEEAGKIREGCDGLMLLPYLSGLNYPFANENARGSFSGVSLLHTRGHFARCVLESIAFLLQQSVDEIIKYGVDVREIISIGGGASSPLWNQIKADVTGKNIIVLDENEVTCKGAAVMASVGAKLFAGFEEAIKSTVKAKRTYAPNAATKYQEIYQVFLCQADEYYKACKNPL